MFLKLNLTKDCMRSYDASTAVFVRRAVCHFLTM